MPTSQVVNNTQTLQHQIHSMCWSFAQVRMLTVCRPYCCTVSEQALQPTACTQAEARAGYSRLFCSVVLQLTAWARSRQPLSVLSAVEAGSCVSACLQGQQRACQASASMHAAGAEPGSFQGLFSSSCRPPRPSRVLVRTHAQVCTMQEKLVLVRGFTNKGHET